MNSSIYLDNSATTPVRDEVVQAIIPYLAERFGNASSIHRTGRDARLAVEAARTHVANLIGAEPSEIFFSPSGTYSNNAALLGRARYVEENSLGRHIITTGIEHSSALGPAKHLASRGWRVTILDVNEQGFIDEEHLLKSIDTDTSIISVMWANNEIGTVQPIDRISKVASEHGIFFHTDAVQAAGKLPIDVSRTPVNTLSITGHKFYAPKGIGALYVRRDTTINPILFGGGQERGLFPGTEGLANIVGLGKAAELATIELEHNLIKLRAMQDIFVETFLRNPAVSFTGARSIARRVPGHVSVLVRGAVGENLVDAADEKGISISSVSACSGRDPSHVLKHLGYSPQTAISAARISASAFNSLEEIEYAASVLSEIFAKHAQRESNLRDTVVVPLESARV
jgi:cysteine desulfurase